MEALNILALWGISNKLILLVGGSVFILIVAIAAWFLIGDDEETDEADEEPKKEKKAKKEKPSKEEKQRAKELKKQEKLAAKEAKAQAKASKPKKEKKAKPAKAPKAVKVKVKKEKKVKTVKPVKAKKPPKPKKKRGKGMAAHKMGAGDYEYVTGLVRSSKSVLLASRSREALPVTIPVKVAMQLAMDGKCLLIDLDVRHDAIAKAFDLEDTPSTKCLRPMPYKTSFDNLFIWPSHNFVRSGHMNIKYLVRAAEEKYDHVLISCPNLNLSPDRKLIASSAANSLIFSCNDKDTEYLSGLIASRGGNVLGNIEITDEDQEQVIEDFTETQEEKNLDDPLGIADADDDSELAELDNLLDIEEDNVQEPAIDENIDLSEIEGESDVESEGLDIDAELDIEGDLDNLPGGDDDAQIDPDIINDLFNDEEEELP